MTRAAPVIDVPQMPRPTTTARTRHSRPGVRPACVMLSGTILVLAASGAFASGQSGPDTIGVRIEAGAGTDITNEQYYEDAFVDTTFLGRRRVNTPETRAAGILYTAIQGTRRARRVAYQIRNELSLGDKVNRDALDLSWRDDFATGWRLALEPSLVWRRDRSFDRDQEEWRAAGRGRLRRTISEATTAELGLVGDLVRSSGRGSEYLLDRDAGRTSLALDHVDLDGDEWRLGYGLATRVFPDSAARDHLEHAWEGRWRYASLAGHSLALETSGLRRQTRRNALNSRDNYWEEFATLEGDWRAGDRWTLRLRVEGDALQYDLEDSTSFFNYRLARGRLGLRFDGQGRWTLSAGPRAEVLASHLNPGEGYREIGGALELEVLGTRALWSVIPSAGWRAYHQEPATASTTDLHSSFAFYELEMFVDQPLLERLRLRALSSLRYEFHTDPSQDAGSFDLSLQLRWLAR